MGHPGAQGLTFANKQLAMNGRGSTTASLADRHAYHNPDTPRLLKSLLFPSQPHARCRPSLLQIPFLELYFFRTPAGARGSATRSLAHGSRYSHGKTHHSTPTLYRHLKPRVVWQWCRASWLERQLKSRRRARPLRALKGRGIEEYTRLL